MRAFATVLFVTLTLAASAPARGVSFVGEPPNALPYEEEPVAEEEVRWLVETMK
ncbi:MAG: hypothetical protein GTN49_05955 [candidate division Zixibacteria bacterium]|nr:hypothetical protein [candidate division Zixibacteria bacterium]